MHPKAKKANVKLNKHLSISQPVTTEKHITLKHNSYLEHPIHNIFRIQRCSTSILYNSISFNGGDVS